MNYEDNFQKQLSMMENLTNAHNALSDTVNKHIEFTTTLADTVRINDRHSDTLYKILEDNVAKQWELLGKLQYHTKWLYILNGINLISIVILAIGKLL